MKGQQLEKLYRETFADFEAGVDPGTWDQIAQSLEQGANAGAGQAAGAAKGTSGLWVGGSLIVAGVVAGLVYLNSPEQPAPVEPKHKSVVTALTTEETIAGETTEPAGQDELPTEQAPQASGEPAPVDPPAPGPNATASQAYFTATDDYKRLADQTLPMQPRSQQAVDLSMTDQPELKQRQEVPAVAAAPDQADETIEFHTPDPEPSAPMMHQLAYPDIITPNGDGKNEIFVIRSENISSLQVQVRDLNGRVVHEWDNLHGFWDGRLGNGDLAPEGTYLINIFAIRADGEPVSEPPLTLELKR